MSVKMTTFNKFHF